MRKCNCLEISSFLANKRVHVTKYFGNLCTYENPLNREKENSGKITLEYKPNVIFWFLCTNNFMFLWACTAFKNA